MENLQNQMKSYGKMGLFFFSEKELDTLHNLDLYLNQKIQTLTEKDWKEIQKLKPGSIKEILTEKEHQEIYYTDNYFKVIQILRKIKAGSLEIPVIKENYPQLFYNPEYPPLLKYVYILAPIKGMNDFSYAKFLADSDFENVDMNQNGIIDSDEEGQYIGSIYNVQEDKAFIKTLQTKLIHCNENFIQDQWSTFLSCYFPLFKQNEFIGILGLDFEVSSQYNILKNIKNVFIYSLIVSGVLVLMVSFLVSLWMYRPIKEITKASEKIARRDFYITLRNPNTTEFKILYRNFKIMAKRLKKYTYKLQDMVLQRTEELFSIAERNAKMTQLVLQYIPRTAVEYLSEQIDSQDKFFYSYYKRKRYTYFFLDLVQYTKFSEGKSPEEIIQTLNQIFQPCLEVIFKNNGDVDKFIGDSIFAFFIKPEEALNAAVEIREIFKNERINLRKFEFRIGIHYGEAVHDNVGNEERREFTLVGDSINVTSRLESIANSGSILVSENVIQMVNENQYMFSNKYLIKLKEKNKYVEARYLL